MFDSPRFTASTVRSNSRRRELSLKFCFFAKQNSIDQKLMKTYVFLNLTT
jgi:hypothetical protein